MASKISFKNSVAEKRWMELHKEKTQLQSKKITSIVDKKIALVNSLMATCKTGFNLTETKVKKIIKFLSDETKIDVVKYGTLPDDSKVISVFYKDIIIRYAEKDNQVFFRENSYNL